MLLTTSSVRTLTVCLRVFLYIPDLLVACSTLLCESTRYHLSESQFFFKVLFDRSPYQVFMETQRVKLRLLEVT